MTPKPSDLSLSFVDSPPALSSREGTAEQGADSEGEDEESMIDALASDLLDATRAGDTEAIADVLRAVRDM